MAFSPPPATKFSESPGRAHRQLGFTLALRLAGALPPALPTEKKAPNQIPVPPQAPLQFQTPHESSRKAYSSRENTDAR